MKPIHPLPHSSSLILFLAIAFVACTDPPPAPQETITGPGVPLALARGPGKRIATIDDLYKAVNDPLNAGMQITLMPNTYMLDPTRAHGGRLELQQDMSIRGLPGHADSVIIDASRLDLAALTDGFQTGAIRLGRGNNAVEWLTVRGATAASGGIETDLVGPGPARIRIANVIATANQRGVDIRNFGPAMAHRTLDVELTDNMLINNTVGLGQGMRIANVSSAGGSIRAVLRNNMVRGNVAGCLAANLNADSCVLVIESTADRLEHNGNGWVFLTGNSSGSGFANANIVRFAAHAGTVEGNGGSSPHAAQFTGGIVGVGATTTGPAPGHVSHNTLTIELWGVRLSGNESPDIAAWGAWSGNGVLPGGNNSVSITLHGVSENAIVVPTPSTPVEPGGTNTVAVLRGVHPHGPVHGQGPQHGGLDHD